jgi:integrase
MYVRGFGTIFRQKGSRFLWMQYWHAGERHRESTCCERPREAKDILRKRLLELDRLSASPGLAPGASRTLVGDLYESLERDYVINGRKSLRDLKTRWHKHLEDGFAAIPVASLTADEISAYIARRLEKKASNGTINRELAVLKRMYKLGIKTGRLKFGEQPYFPMLRERNVRKGFLKDAQYADLARATGEIGLWLRGLFELGYSYGWRKSELLGLRVSQVDLCERTITLHAGETKNDDARTIEMTGTVYELLAGLVVGKAPGDKVFTRGASKRPIAGFRKAWERATKAAGCEGLLFHDLRRSAARNLIRSGVSEKVAMEVTGHRTRSVFARYNITDRSDVRDAVRKLEKSAARRAQHELFEQAEFPFESGVESGDPPRKPAVSEGMETLSLRALNLARKPS